MIPPRSDQHFVRMPDAEFEAMLARAAEEGAKCAKADVGLDGDEAALGGIAFTIYARLYDWKRGRR